MTTRLDKYISELLYDYDCVIIPRLGGIVTNYKPARFEKGMAYPPGKELRFNKNLTKNDGLLAQCVSEIEEMSVQKADAFVQETVEHYLKELNGGNRVELNKVGILYIDDHRNLRFEPDTSVNYLRSAFGFEVFKLPEPKIQLKPAIEEKVEESPKIIPLKSPGHTKGIYRVAAATLAPFIAMSVYLALTTDFKSPTEISPAEIFPLSTKSKSQYEPRDFNVPAPTEEVEKTAFPENSDLFQFDFNTNEVSNGGAMVDLRKSSSAVKVKESAPQSIGLYHIIGGCFSEKTNAENFVDRLKMRGYASGILDMNKGLYRVRIESYDEYDEALNKLKIMRQDGTFPNAWLLKKKNANHG